MRYSDMRIQAFAARSMVYRTARIADNGENVINEVIACKVFATEMDFTTAQKMHLSATKRNLAAALCNVFADDNRRFDANRFLAFFNEKAQEAVEACENREKMDLSELTSK